jgi:hypothetical protein
VVVGERDAIVAEELMSADALMSALRPGRKSSLTRAASPARGLRPRSDTGHSPQ